MTCRVLAAIALLLYAPSATRAHAIGVEAKLKADVVRVEAFFDDDTPAADAKVALTDAEGKVVAAGRTDAKGLWSFPAPPPGRYRLAVDAGEGHLARTTITIPSVPLAPPAPPSAAEAMPPGQGSGAVVSDGLTRAERTGPWRWLMAGLGVGTIALLACGLRFVLRRAGRPGVGAPR